MVFAAADAGRFSITVSYPTTVEREQAEADLATMQQATGWRFAAPQISTEQGLTQVSAILFDNPSANGSPVWPVVWALKRYNRVTVLLAGIGKGRFMIIPGMEGKFIYIMKRHFPALVAWIMDRDVRKAAAKGV